MIVLILKNNKISEACLYCDHCGKRNPGIHMIDNKLICFDCRSAQAAKRGDTVVMSGVSSTPAAAPAAASNTTKAQFCGQCGKKRLENAAFCGECGSKF